MLKVIFEACKLPEMPHTQTLDFRGVLVVELSVSIAHRIAGEHFDAFHPRLNAVDVPWHREHLGASWISGWNLTGRGFIHQQDKDLLHSCAETIGPREIQELTS